MKYIFDIFFTGRDFPTILRGLYFRVVYFVKIFCMLFRRPEPPAAAKPRPLNKTGHFRQHLGFLLDLFPNMTASK